MDWVTTQLISCLLLVFPTNTGIIINEGAPGVTGGETCGRPAFSLAVEERLNPRELRRHICSRGS
jgi:hypothetical protein